MRLILTAILTVLCFATQALSEEKIVFDNMEQVYIDLDGFKNCKIENSQLTDLVTDKDNQINIANKQIVLLKSGIELCNSYADKIDLSMLELEKVISNQNNIKQTSNKFDIKTISVSILIGFLLGTSLHLGY